jgi:hypothetical protein
MLDRSVRRLTTVLQDLRAQPLRTAITTASMFIGVVAVVLTSVAGVIAQEVFVAREEQRTAREVTYDVHLSFARPDADAVTAFWAALTTRTQHQPVAMVLLSAQTMRAQALGAESPTAGPTALASVVYLGDYPAVRRLPVISGRWPSTGALPPTVSLNQSAAEALPDHRIRLSEDTRVPHVDVQVAGVVADAEDTATVYLPWPVAAAFLPHLAAPAEATLRVTTDSGMAAVKALATSAVAGQGITVTDIARYDSVGSIRDQLATLQLVFAACAIIALTIAALGILNLGLATVTHRARELSVRRAVGARKSDLFALVLGSSIAAGLVAAALALTTVAVGIQVVVPLLIPVSSAIVPPALPWTTVLLGCLAALATALLGALLPALRASRVDIASVLRD